MTDRLLILGGVGVGHVRTKPDQRICKEGRCREYRRSCLTDLDYAPFFKGAPNDQCQAHHVGYVRKGKFGVRRADEVEEIFEAGDAFTIEPGHIPIAYAGSEYVAFTPTMSSGIVAPVQLGRSRSRKTGSKFMAYRPKTSLSCPASANRRPEES